MIVVLPLLPLLPSIDFTLEQIVDILLLLPIALPLAMDLPLAIVFPVANSPSSIMNDLSILLKTLLSKIATLETSKPY